MNKFNYSVFGCISTEITQKCGSTNFMQFCCFPSAFFVVFLQRARFAGIKTPPTRQSAAAAFQQTPGQGGGGREGPPHPS